LGHRWKGELLVRQRWKGRTTVRTQTDGEDNWWKGRATSADKLGCRKEARRTNGSKPFAPQAHLVVGHNMAGNNS
jgi:hypothetical protein